MLKMLDNFKRFAFFFAFTVLKVTSVDFTLSSNRVLLGSTGTLTMNCDITEADVENLYFIQIRRLKFPELSGLSDADWQTLTFMEIRTTETPTLENNVVANTKDYVADGSWDSVTPSNTNLALSMNMEKLVCGDARYYRCEISYKSTTIGSTVSANKNATFLAFVKPQVTSLTVKKNGFIVQGMSPSDMASAEVGDELELTCTANIGSLPNTIIRWHRTSEMATTDEFIGYQPPQGTFTEGTATTDNQCGYTRVATIKYNATAADANRLNNLAFDCYVLVTGDLYGNSYTSENNPIFFTEVTEPDGGQTIAIPDDGQVTDRNEISVTAGAFAASVLASLTVGVLIGVALSWIILSKKRKIKDPLDSMQQTGTMSRETEFNGSPNSLNTYEQLQDRTDTESRTTYDALDGNSSATHVSQSYYESLKHGAGTSQTYAGLNHS